MSLRCAHLSEPSPAISHRPIRRALSVALSCLVGFLSVGHSRAAPTDGWYLVREVAPATYAIGEPQSSQRNVSYLLVGSERALLVDSGSGERPIRGLIEAWTDLPVLVLYTHFHFDHVANVPEFSEVAMIDLPYLRVRVRDGGIQLTSSEYLAAGPPIVPVTEWVPPGGHLDLGDRSVRVLSVPGHTAESVAVVDDGAELVLLGDFLYDDVLLASLPGGDLDAYEDSTRDLLVDLPSSYRLYGAHTGASLQPQVPYGSLETLERLFACVAVDDCDGRRTSGFPGFVFHLEDGLVMSTDCRFCPW